VILFTISLSYSLSYGLILGVYVTGMIDDKNTPQKESYQAQTHTHTPALLQPPQPLLQTPQKPW